MLGEITTQPKPQTPVHHSSLSPFPSLGWPPQPSTSWGIWSHRHPSTRHHPAPTHTPLTPIQRWPLLQSLTSIITAVCHKWRQLTFLLLSIDPPQRLVAVQDGPLVLIWPDRLESKGRISPPCAPSRRLETSDRRASTGGLRGKSDHAAVVWHPNQKATSVSLFSSPSCRILLGLYFTFQTFHKSNKCFLVQSQPAQLRFELYGLRFSTHLLHYITIADLIYFDD